LLDQSSNWPGGETDTVLSNRKRNLLIGLLVVAAVSAVIADRFGAKTLGAKGSPPADRMAGLPRIILWAWERPESLAFVNPQEVGVAFLAKTIYLTGERVLTRPRLQPVSFPEGASLIAVVRIESDPANAPALTPDQREQTVAAIAELARNKSFAAVQIDYDARQSEREFYRNLLNDLRSRLPDSTKLSITALASWCIGDNWLDDLPIDEAVPMLFRMGADSHTVSEFLRSGRDFSAEPSRHSLGISTDEPLANLPPGRRVYVFNPHSWTKEEVTKTVEEVKQWQSRKQEN
jgi:Protein of unknown function (DUF3142)